MNTDKREVKSLLAAAEEESKQIFKQVRGGKSISTAAMVEEQAQEQSVQGNVPDDEVSRNPQSH